MTIFLIGALVILTNNVWAWGVFPAGIYAATTKSRERKEDGVKKYLINDYKGKVKGIKGGEGKASICKHAQIFLIWLHFLLPMSTSTPGTKPSSTCCLVSPLTDLRLQWSREQRSPWASPLPSREALHRADHGPGSRGSSENTSPPRLSNRRKISRKNLKSWDLASNFVLLCFVSNVHRCRVHCICNLLCW